MILQAITEGVISSINVPTLVSIKQSTGYTVASDFTQVPAYTTYGLYVDLQALTFDDLRQVDALNIQGEKRKMYVTGQVNGLVRYAAKGGDVVTVTDATSTWNGTVWLVSLVTEFWQGWNSSVITLQNGS
jgi:hypothetical protein